VDLVTAFGSATQLTATIPAGLLTSSGVFPVQVVNPGPKGSLAKSFSVEAPISLTAIYPPAVAAGSPDFTLTLSGAGFVSGAVAKLNGTSLTTTFVNSGALTAIVPAALVGAPGTPSITAANPSNATTAAKTLTVKTLSISNLNPQTGPIGTAVTVSGTGLDLLPAVRFAKQGGGVQPAPVLSGSPTSLSITVPAGAATGVVSLFSGALSVPGPTFTVTTSRTFNLTGGPPTGVLFPGKTTAFSLKATTADGFAGLVSLAVNGLPAGVTHSLVPPTVSAEQVSILTLTAPANQPTGVTPFTVTGTSSIEGQTIQKTVNLSVDVQPITTTFLGRCVSSDETETPLQGVTVKFTGKDDAGNATGCSVPQTTTDVAGNYRFSNLPAQCTGTQLVSFNGLTVTNPPGQIYAGVNLRYVIAQNVVNPAPVLTHLVRIDSAETKMVTQNSGVLQSFTFSTIAGLKVDVYPGTTFFMPDGSQPNPFPLTAARVATDRLPDRKVLASGQILSFIVAFQPADAYTNAPVAVDYPNTASSTPGTALALLTLDPVKGMMVMYGTGTVSADAISLVADANPATPGKRFGITRFDWHGPMAVPPPPTAQPAKECCFFGSDVSAGDDGRPITQAGIGTKINRYLESGDWNTPTSAEFIDALRAREAGQETAPGGPELEEMVEREMRHRRLFNGAANSVELATGVEEYRVTEASIRDVPLPAALVRTYRSNLGGFAGPFGLGTNHNFGYTVLADGGSTAPLIQLSFPNGRRIGFVRQMDGSYIVPFSGETAGSTLRWDVPLARWRLTTVDGSEMRFVPVFGMTSPLDSIHDRRGNKTQLGRITGAGSTSLVQTITAMNGETITLAYDGQNRVTSVTDAGGRVTSYTYDGSGRLQTVTDPALGVTTFGYDSQHRLTSITDPRNVMVIQKAYNAAGRVISETFPDTGVRTYTYTTANPDDPTTNVLKTVVTDPLGHSTTYRFTVNGQLTDVTDAAGQVTTFTRDTVTGLVLSRTGSATCEVCGDPASGDVKYEYDAKGRLTKVTDALNHFTTYGYAPNGSIASSVTDPLLHTTTYGFNAAGDVTSVTDPLLQTTTMTYDPQGRLLTVANPMSHTMTLAYGTDGRLASVTDPLGRATLFGYDAAHRLSDVTNPDGTHRFIQYDALDRVTRQEDEAGRATTYAYDPAGNLLTVTDASGNVTSVEYNYAGLATKRTAAGKFKSLVYDKALNLTSKTDDLGRVTTYAYDALDRPTQVSHQDGAVITYGWDQAGRMLFADDGVGGRVERTYDAVGRLTREVTASGAVTFGYDNTNRRTSRTGPDGTTTYGYTVRDQISSVVNGGTSATFTYDDAGRRTVETLPNGVSASYGYDSARQLTHIGYSGPGVSESRDYVYDAMGRITRVTAGNLTAPLGTDQLNTAGSANRLTAVNGAPQTHDAAGRLTGDGTHTVTWDDRHQLRSVAGPVASTYSYDALGRRIRKVENGSVSSYVYDGSDVLRVTTNGVATDFLRGLGLDQTYAETTAGAARTYLRDRVGSVIGTAGAAGTRLLRYDEFGEYATSGSGPLPFFTFQGREADANGFTNVRTRYYSAETGRFLSEDRIGFAGGDANLYRFVGNMPGDAIDPNGTELGFGWAVVAFGWRYAIVSTVQAAASAVVVVGTVTAAGVITVIAVGAAGYSLYKSCYPDPPKPYDPNRTRYNPNGGSVRG
jgi:RHS repeat-associated protein